MKTFILLLSKALPIFALIFVIGVVGYKLYINIRSRFGITVNCWFCNENTHVKFSERNQWTCPHCEQYNGFKNDGDYNRDILSQRDCSTHSDKSSPGKVSGSKGSICANAYYGSDLCSEPPRHNGLCNECNEAQRLKIEKLAQFEPRSESRFEQELKLYQNELEQKYRLCRSCERHVDNVLHEKKKMVLGSKFLNFIMKGAALLKQPHFQRLALVQQQRRLEHYELIIMLLTALNIICLLCTLPVASLDQFKELLGDFVAKPIYFVYSHALTMLRLLIDYSTELLAKQPYATKPMRFASILGKMFIYSVGMSPNQAAQATFSSCYTSIYPYAMLALNLICNMICGLKLTRYTVLTLLWSILAKRPVLLFGNVDGLLASLGTLLLLKKRQRSLQQMSVDESFHRLCADECINDDDTISLLSQQLSYNATSNVSSSSSNCLSPQLCKPIQNPQANPNRNQTGTSSVLSLDSLCLSSQRPPVNDQPWAATAPPYRSQTPLYSAGGQDPQAWHNNYSTNMHMDAMWQRGGYADSRQPVYSCGLEQRPLTRSTQNLLLPSRLKSQHQQPHGDISAWVNAASGYPQPDLMQEPSTTLLQSSCNRDLSRTSSQSSGFESQLGNNVQRQEVPHIWSLPPELPQQTVPQPLQTVPQPQQTVSQPQQQPHLNSSLKRDYGFQVHVPQCSASAALSSELGRSAASPLCQREYRPGDLLRKWIDRGGVASAKSNGALN